MRARAPGKRRLTMSSSWCMQGGLRSRTVESYAAVGGLHEHYDVSAEVHHGFAPLGER